MNGGRVECETTLSLGRLAPNSLPKTIQNIQRGDESVKCAPIAEERKFVCETDRHMHRSVDKKFRIDHAQSVGKALYKFLFQVIVL